ncbi:MAG: adenylosuccinate lyase [Anaerolineales bacterium]|jgi:adenylosuccinate lyase
MTFETYQSPYSWRYGSEALRRIWSEHNKRLLWRKIWVALAEAQAEFDLVTAEQVADLKRQAGNIDIPRAMEIEAEIHHDLMAEIRAYAEQCPAGGGIIHLGATSMDIVDNTDALRVKQSLRLIRPKLAALILALLELVETQAETSIIAMTHIQPAEPSTLGYRFAVYAQDLFTDWDQLAEIDASYAAKGFKGAVGTAAGYVDLVGAENFNRFEKILSDKLAIPFFPVTTQTMPRKQDLRLMNALASMGSSLYKFAFDLRILQSPPFGEWHEPFREKQVGSSAMPFKRNPINAEKINSLARLLAQYPRIAWDNAAHSLLERTLDDSANRRTHLPEALLIADELLIVSKRIVDGLAIDQEAIRRNLLTYAPFAATERVMLAAVKKGADRQQAHEFIRQHAMSAWEAVQAGKPNPLTTLVSQDDYLREFLTADEILALFDATQHTGIAAERAKKLVQQAAPLKAWLENFQKE